MPKKWTPTSKKVECKFCNLELLYEKDPMVPHLGYKKFGKMQGVALCQCQGPIFKALFSRCNGVWPVVLDDYIKDMRDDVVGFQGQVSCSAHSNANEIKLIHRPQHSQWQGIGCQRGLLNPTYVPNIKWAERLSGPNTLFQGKLFAPFGDISLLGPASHDIHDMTRHDGR